jgi:hypothetical protein
VLIIDDTGFLKKGVRSARGAAAVFGDGGPYRELPDRDLVLMAAQRIMASEMAVSRS